MSYVLCNDVSIVLPTWIPRLHFWVTLHCECLYLLRMFVFVTLWLSGQCHGDISVYVLTLSCSVNSITAAPKHPDSGGPSHLRSLSSWMLSRPSAGPQVVGCGPLQTQAEGSGVFTQLPWQYQQVRTKKRGMEYQPKNIKRKRTHGWIKRVSTQGGIEVLLRRMLKGRKSLSHWRF